MIIEVGGSTKIEKATITTTNDNNSIIIEINVMYEPTYEDIERMEHSGDNEEEEEYRE